jgi:hypothetical protein
MIFTKELLSQIKITPIIETLRLEDISDKEYFGEKFSGYISNSRMSLINPAQGGTPQTYFEGLSKNNKFSSSLAFGSAVHELSLQPESFYLCDEVFAPTAKVGLMADLLWINSKKGEVPPDDLIRQAAIKVDYYKGIPTPAQLSKVKEAIRPYFKARYKFEQNSTDERTPIFLDEKSKDRLLEVMDSLNNNEAIQKLLHPTDLLGDPLPSSNEKTILLNLSVKLPDIDEPVILRLKAKLDNYTIDKVSNIITVNDVKTTGKLCSEFDNAVKSFHYYREIAFYSWLLSLCAKQFFEMENPTVKGNFLVVETIPSYWSSVVEMKPNWFTVGVKEFLTLIKMIAYYTANGYEEN